jgi:hypothetical protein
MEVLPLIKCILRDKYKYLYVSLVTICSQLSELCFPET